MNSLPEHLYWAIENKAERALTAFYWRKVRNLARVLSVPISLINASDSLRMFDSLYLSKQKIAELHEQREQEIEQELKEFQALFLKRHIETNFQIITERPFFKAAINLVKQQESNWLVAQS